MRESSVVHDERTESVEKSSYRWAYYVVSFGLLAAVFWRAVILGQSSWDLMALVVLGGVVATVYQGRRGILTFRWARTAVIAAAVAAVAAVPIAVMLLR